MINSIFSSQKRFTFLFFVVLFVDIWVKLNCPVFPYRFISKPLVILFLLMFYNVNKRGRGIKYHLWVFLGLSFFLVGDLLIINAANIIFLGLSLFFFSLGKIFFCLKFSHKKDFNVLRLVPFSIIMFSYAVFIIGIVLNELKEFLVPALLSFFLSLLMIQFAYLRKGVFNNKSYWYVLLGVTAFIISESIMAVKTFKQDLPFQDFLIMMLYGTAMYFIVLGIVSERRYKISFS
ncbi:lysoplasmalogenase family protein [Snuella lapsa]